MMHRSDCGKAARRGEMLFVYGTLRRKCANAYAKRMQRYVRYVTHGKVAGCLYQTLEGYPALTLRCRRNGVVVGEVYRVVDAKRLFRFLDAYELCCLGDSRQEEYRRCRTVIDIGDGTVDAWVYVYRRSTRGLRRLRGRFAYCAFYRPKY